MSESLIQETLVVEGLNKVDVGKSVREYDEQGVILSAYKGAPHIRPVAGGATVTTTNERTGKDKVVFHPRGSKLVFDNKLFHHEVEVK